MSYVMAAPELMTSAATDLATIGSNLSAAHTAAATQTTGVAAAAEDEVSAAIAALLSTHGQQFQALGAQTAAFHQQFMQNVTAGAASYVGTEAANIPSLTALLDSIPSVPANVPKAVPMILNPIFDQLEILTRSFDATVQTSLMQARLLVREAGFPVAMAPLGGTGTGAAAVTSLTGLLELDSVPPVSDLPLPAPVKRIAEMILNPVFDGLENVTRSIDGVIGPGGLLLGNPDPGGRLPGPGNPLPHPGSAASYAGTGAASIGSMLTSDAHTLESDAGVDEVETEIERLRREIAEDASQRILGMLDKNPFHEVAVGPLL
jgi:hypothetical protein